MNKQTSVQVDQTSTTQEKWHLNILILCWEFPPNIVGGLSRHVFGLSQHLAKMGHAVHVLTAGTNDLDPLETVHGVHVHRVQPVNQQDDHFLNWMAGLNLAMAFKAEQLAEEIRFDLLHAHDWLVGAAAIALKESLSIPLVTTIHATEHGRNNGIHTELQQFIHKKESQLIFESDQLIVCSEYMKDEVVTIFQAKAEGIAVIPNGIEPLEIKRTLIELYPELSHKKYIFSIGRMVQEKGFSTILETAVLAKQLNQDLVFVIAGKGPMLKNYQQQAAAANLQEQVIFTGFVNDEQRNALLQGCEIAVFPSLYEPFGIVALESMVLGKPTIVSNTGGLKGIVKHLQTGLLMVPGDPQSLLEQINFLMNNAEAAEQLGQRGRKMVNGLYGWKRIAAETSRVMEDTLVMRRVYETGHGGTTK